MKKLCGKTAIVTGALSDVGFSAAQSFAREGINLMLCDLHDAELRRTVVELRHHGVQVDYTFCDVTNIRCVTRVAELAIQKFGKIHFLVNSAKLRIMGEVGVVSREDWRWIIDVNLTGLINTTETFLPYLRDHNEGGHIVNAASIYGHIAAPFHAPLCATEFALVGYSEAIRQELSKHGIGVSIFTEDSVCTEQEKDMRDQSSYLKNSASPSEALPGFEGTHNHSGDLIVEGIISNHHHIFANPVHQHAIKLRNAMIRADYERCDQDVRPADQRASASCS